jgi:hypothetical protein
LNEFSINGIISNAFSVTTKNYFSDVDLDLSSQTSGSLYLLNGQFSSDSLSAELTGNVIDGIQVGSQGIFPPVLNGQSVSIDRDGSTYGVVICEDGIYLCDLPYIFGNINNWKIADGNSLNNLSNPLLSSLCNVETCPDGQISFQLNYNSQCADFLFLVDNSASVNKTTEYPLMQQSIANTIFAIDQTGIDARYAIVQFSGTAQFQLTIPWTSDPNIATQFTYAFNQSTDVGSAVNNVLNSIDDGTLALRSGCTFHFVNYNDAWKYGSSNTLHTRNYTYFDGYNPYNSTKEPPYSAVVSVIRYQGSYDDTSNPVAASIASFGGSYCAPGDPGCVGLGSNPDDPDEEIVPRRLYLANDFSDPLTDLYEDITSNNILESILEFPCEIPLYEWSVANGGQIISNNGWYIETNGTGDYILNVLCDNDCMYTGQFSYQTSGIRVSNPKDRSRIEKGIRLTPAESEYAEGRKVEIKYNSKLSMQVIPNPSDGHLLLHINSPETFDGTIEIRSSNAALVLSFKGELVQGHNSIPLVLNNVASGMYFIRLIGSGYDISKRAVIIK